MLSDNIQYIECAAVTDRYIAIGYYNQYDKKNYEDLPLQTAGVYVYDMKSKKGRTIFYDFYTGQQKANKARGRIEQFNKKYGFDNK